MNLNGWHRSWVVLTGAWTIAIAVMTWSKWPLPYGSLDPLAGLQAADTVAKRTNEIFRNGETLTKAQLINQVRAKCLECRGIADQELLKSVIVRFPSYRPFITDLDWFEQHTPTAEELNSFNRRAAISRGATVWVLPPIALYLCGWAVAWIRGGFRRP